MHKKNVSQIRLSDQEQNRIIEIFKKNFDKEDHLWLFGSRIDPKKRGGDIDLYIETVETNAAEIINKKLSFVNDLWLALGEQKIDVVIRVPNQDFDLPIYHEAKSQGFKLV